MEQLRTRRARSERNVLDCTIVMEGRPLRIARVEAALRDLRRVGRNLDMVSLEDYQEILEEQADVGSRDKGPAA